MTASEDGSRIVISCTGLWVAYAYTFFIYSAFAGALVIGVALHYKDLVSTEFYEFPQEWFPSVSATIGNFYPERSVFHIFIALCSGPRFTLVLLWYFLSCERESRISKLLIAIGLLQTFLFGVWAYVTSTEDILIHEISGLSYLACSLPWTLAIISVAPSNRRAQLYRKIIAGCLYFMWIPMILFFILHKKNVAGAYSFFALSEWAVVFLVAGFDVVSIFDFGDYKLQVVKQRAVEGEESENLIRFEG